ncbi:MAG: hypothetical protein HY996_08090 [Micrococcales bacterium]|nr:hypothetical protein [Micrococcales bacterium]
MIRTPRPLVVLALAAALAASGAALSGCSIVRNVTEQASGGKVDIGGKSVPKSFPKDVPLAQGQVVYGASVAAGTGRVWNVTIKVSGTDAMTGIAGQLTGAGFTASGQVGQDATGSTAVFTKPPYTVNVVIAKPDAATGWVANYTVASTPGASPAPSATTAP